MSIGHNIKDKRLKKGLSQEQLANEVYISQATLSNIEKGKSIPDILLLQHFAEALECSFEDLLENESVVVNNNNQQGGIGYAQVVNQLSEKLIEQYEARILEKDIRIKELEQLLKVT